MKPLMFLCFHFTLIASAGGLVSFDEPGARAVAKAFEMDGIHADLLGWVECQTPPEACGYRLSLGEEPLKEFSPQATTILVEEMMRNETVPRYANPNAGMTYLWMSHVQCEENPKTKLRACYFAEDV